LRSLLPSDFIGWILLVLIVAFAVGLASKGVDWMDRRACRTSGGAIHPISGSDDEWRCAGAEVPR
jgi:hypothetical protein